jgi:dTDP-4-amino-4,6-dideoxygalactose transaminase
MTAVRAVPFLDLATINGRFEAEFAAALQRVSARGQWVLGPEVAAFEAEFAACCGSAHAIGVGNGLDALELVLRAWDIGPGDEVIVPSHTFIATWLAVTLVGATVVPVRTDPDTHLIDGAAIEAAIGPRTRALIPVHLYGRPAPMDEIMDLARTHGLRVLEDAAQAHGARWRGARAGSLGDAAAFSFYPGKNLGAYGEAGMVVTDNDEHARTLRMLRDWGAEKKYEHLLKGYNYRMEGIQGAVLRVKMRHIEAWTEARRAHAAQYDQLLAGSGVLTPQVMSDVRHVYHIYAIRTRQRQQWIDALQAQGIQTGIHYPFPVHLLPAYADLGYKAGDFPHSERAANEVLSLPMFPELTEDDCSRVAEAVAKVARAP